MSDGTTTTHEPINGGNGAICAVCAMRRPVMLEGFSVPIAIYTPAPWPCDAAKAEAENARLRERVAALLEGAEERADASDSLVLSLTDALADAVLLIHETRHAGEPAECAVRVCEIGKQLVQAARQVVVDNLAAALAQAGEGGAA